MSGHSKWSSIKHKKGAADKKRGQLFSKLSRAIIVAAREGGPDPVGNLALQNAVEKARSYSMPKDNIERAIARGSGADARGGGGRCRRHSARRVDVAGHRHSRVLVRRARGDRGSRFHGRERRADDDPEDHSRGRGRERCEEDSAPDRCARGKRRRAGRLLELRHPRARAGDGRRLSRARRGQVPVPGTVEGGRGFVPGPSRDRYAISTWVAGPDHDRGRFTASSNVMSAPTSLPSAPFRLSGTSGESSRSISRSRRSWSSLPAMTK